MDISSLNSSFNLNTSQKASSSDPKQISLDAQAKFSQILANLTSGQQSSADQSNSELSNLFRNSTPQSDKLDTATLTKQIEEGDSSLETLHKLLFAYERDRWNLISSIILGDTSEEDNNSAVI